jgi:23S rRNA (guanosine2251-2'-O)-methyltransferase
MKAHRDRTQSIWISGINPVREALASDHLILREMILGRDDQRARELMDLAAKKGLPVQHRARDAISALVGHEHHQGVAVQAEEYVYTPLEEILNREPSAKREPLLVLDCIQDPQNLGALARSACFLGAKGLIIPKDRSASITATVIKISAGAMSYLPVVRVVNLARALEQIKDAGIWIVGLDIKGGSLLHEVDLTVPVGLVIGNEQKGLRSLVRAQCDILAHIAAHGPLQSLNAAAAGAIALAEVQSQRSSRIR